ncbi:hypothetical protein NUW58_g6814 [Xylaria curta]|uniref:Uncharacterized protein n=1 Tax=Xylaria curta TaxID=42375 RepID=A0ACC1NRA2_9PEZI|nr:hypothetical protein NUW58_g6814 [Xylaria curta]
MIRIIWGLGLLIGFSLAEVARTPVVDLGYAKYRGSYNSAYDLNLFRGIRYAAPPVGKLRWQMPQAPAKNRSGILPAVDYAPQCPQSSPTGLFDQPPQPSGDEDCLFLNVVAPANGKRKPVLVWIHGGGYGLGNNRFESEFMQQIRTNGNSYVGVSVAYRLGAFGFLSSAEVGKFGVVNAAVHDLRFALKWVKKNIRHFGGDPEQVTIAGISAGGGSVMLLAMANGGREGDALFHGLITASPYLPTQWNFDDAWPTLTYEAFVDQAGCSDAEVKFECLQLADTAVLQNASNKVSAGANFGQWAFIPVTDGKLIRKRPSEQLAASKNTNGLRLLTSNTANEGPLFTPQNITDEEGFINFVLTNYPRLSEQNLTSILELYTVPENASEVYADSNGLTPPFSTTNSNCAVGWQQAANNLYAETTFACPSYWMADAFANAKGKSSWKYQFSVPTSIHGSDGDPLSKDPKVQGTGMDEVFRTAFQKIWGNFIITGDPTLSPTQTHSVSRGNITAASTGNWPQWDGRPKDNIMLNLNMTGGMPVITPTQLGGKTFNLTSYVPSTGGSYPELEAEFELVPAWSWEGGRDNMVKMRDAADESSGRTSVDRGCEIGRSETRIDPSVTTTQGQTVAKFLRAITWVPPWCRYNPHNPPKFTLSMNILLAFSTTFTVANLYYAQPILNVIASEFKVSYERSSNVATLSQAGYASGLLLVCPLGDLIPRRPLILFLIFATATMWIGLCLTTNFEAFVSLSYLCGVGTVTPQLMLPLVGDLAPAHRLFFTLPDYPATNQGLNYFRALGKMAVLVTKEPLLIQACLIGFLMSAAFTNFWTTLTFLLASPPYSYSSLDIGLFAFIGIAVISLAPVWSRLITDKFVFLFSSILGISVDLVGITIGTFIGTFTVAGPVIQAIFMDTGANFAHTANRSNIYGLDPKARNRINTVYMVFCFAGQLTGTAAGNRLYAQGGWTWSGSMNIGFIGLAILIGLARGPRETGWVGWKGGWNIRRDENIAEKNERQIAAEEPQALREPTNADDRSAT